MSELLLPLQSHKTHNLNTIKMRNYIQNFDKQDLTELVLLGTFVGITFQVLYIVQGL